jgi:muramoyltetrapeptide carboxypeptidase
VTLGQELAPRLRPGDRVRLVSPASFPDAEWLATSVAILRNWDLAVEVGEHATDQWGFMAGRDAYRLHDLNDAFRDPGVRAVFAILGGAGTYRITGGIDAEAVRADPKPVIGFSDITHLHLWRWKHCQAPGVHGCLAGEQATTTLRRLLMDAKPVTAHRDPEALSAAIEVPGQATGFLMGGHLGSVRSAIGVDLPRLDGAILCLEGPQNASEETGLDRTLHHLVRSGALAGIRGIALGDITGSDETIGPAALDTLRRRLGSLGVPVLGGLPFGHLSDQVCLPLGTPATLDTTAGTLTVEAPVC